MPTPGYQDDDKPADTEQLNARQETIGEVVQHAQNAARSRGSTADEEMRRKTLFGDATRDQQAEAATAARHPDDAAVAELIDVYFELQEPAERDTLFEELLRCDSPLVTDFLRLMAEHDEDDFMRAAATAQLARRGDANALEGLAAYLDDPDDPFFFEEAVEVLSDILGAAFYPTLQTIWLDAERPADQCCHAMSAMEALDTERALADFVAFLDEIDDLDTLPDDQVEAAAMAFARHDHRPGANALVDLHDRILSSTVGTADDRDAAAGMLRAAIDLILAP